MAPSFNTQQWLWLTTYRLPICFLSTLSDLIIIHVVHHNKYKGPYNRILFGMSIFDGFLNLGWSMQPWGIQNDDTLCKFTAMFFQLGLGTFIYAGILSIYFVLTIRFGMKDEKIAKWYEPWMHFISVGYPFATAVTGIIIDGYKPDPISMTCYMHEFEEDGGGYHFFVFWIYAGGPLLVVLSTCIASYVIIYRHVQTTINRGRSRSRIPAISVDDDSQTRRIRAVAVQAMSYVAVSLATTLPIPILTALWMTPFMDATSVDVVFAVTFILFLFVPFTGFLNLCVYIRPKYCKLRTDFPTMGRFWAIRRCCLLGGKEPVVQARRKKKSGAKNYGGNNMQLPEPAAARNDDDHCNAETCNANETEPPLVSPGAISHASTSAMSESTRTILMQQAEFPIDISMSTSTRTDLAHCADLSNSIEKKVADSKASGMSMSQGRTSPTAKRYPMTLSGGMNGR